MSNSKYVEITIATTSLSSDLVANVLFETGADAVSIIDKNDLTDLYKNKETWDYIDDSLFDIDEICYVKTGVLRAELADKISQIKIKLAELKKSSPFDLGSLEIDSKEIVEEDWRYVWRKYYKPIKVGKFVVIPKWIDYKLSNEEYPIYIEPGMAFGTGEHETTKNALKLISDVDIKGKVVADIGTGSGILGIGASRLGAKYVYMTDIDEQCIKTSKENAELNEILNCEIECCNLFDKSIDKVDIVIANITADVLKILASGINDIIKDDGKVILSGILNTTLDSVIDVYKKVGLKVIKHISDGEWHALLLEK